MDSDNTAPEIAIIGSGFGFQEILPAVLSAGNYTVNLMKPRNYSESKYKVYESPNISFASFDEIANKPQIKIVFIALPPFLQFEYVERLAPFGKSIYLEKPGGLNADDALKIQHLIEKNHSNIYLGFQFRFDPIIQISVNHVQEFAVTEKKMAKIQWNIKKSTSQEGWKRDLKKGGGVYRDHLCHVVDLLRNSYGFSDESFGPNLKLLSERHKLIDHVSLNSKNLEIEIHRDINLDSSLQIFIETPKDQILIKNEYPFKLRNYSLIRNTKQINLPETLNLNADARRFALISYISRVLTDEFRENSPNHKIEYPSIEDAIFTQRIADRINAI
jgi:predicted dehydrogenase